MSPAKPGASEFPFGDGVHLFRLAIGELRELEQKRDCGVERLARRLVSDDWRVDDVIEPIRIGLIGAGMEPLRALALIERYAHLDLRSHRLLAAAILSRALAIDAAVDEVAPKKPRGRRGRKTPAAPGREGSPTC